MQVEKPENDETLCRQCRQIDFQKILALPLQDLQNVPRGVVITRLKRGFGKRKLRPCSLCWLFAQLLGAKHNSAGYELRAISLLRSYRGVSWQHCPKGLKEHDQVCLAVVPLENLAPTLHNNLYWRGALLFQNLQDNKAAFFAPRAVSRTFDPLIVKRWMDYCMSHHRKSCVNFEKQPINLKVIDCKVFGVKLAPRKCRYIALSYVWGQSHRKPTPVHRSEGKTSMPPSDELPQTILDAISVTLTLGYRYLWVDRYCIDQDNAPEKQEQIRIMDAVYKGAVLTLIAAAGACANAGLSGVGLRERANQPSVQISQTRVLATMRHPYAAIRTSPWNSRAWTFQESVLSIRRLAFTDDQMYFECRAMNCYESLECDLDLTHTEDRSKRLECLHPGTFGENQQPHFEFIAIDPQQPTTRLENLNRLLKEYSRKHLSHEEDIENAFAGIARSFARSKTPVLMFCGILFLKPSGRYSQTLQCFDSFSFGLTWDFDQLVSPDQESQLRRPDFPSWSWLAWRGAVSWSPISGCHFRSALSDISFEFENSVWSFHDLISQASTPERLVNCRPVALRARVPQITSELFQSYRNEAGFEEWTFRGWNSTGGVATADESCGLQLPHRPQKLSFFFVGQSCYDDRPHTYRNFIMIAENRQDSFSRVGSLFVDSACPHLITAEDCTEAAVRII